MSKESGLSGLYNLGNTCYINSILQILSHTHDLKNNIFKSKLNNCNDTLLLKEWINLDKLIWSKNCVIKPNRFINVLHSISNYRNNNLFNGFEQNDASEFIIFLFESFHNSCKKNVEMNIKGQPLKEVDKIAIECYKSFIKLHQNDYSVIIQLFYSMQITYNIKMIDNTTISYCCQSNFILNLPINRNTETLYDCFDYYLKDEELKDENSIIDEKDNKKYDAIQKTVFWNLPTILIVSFKRFSYDGTKKENKLIKFPINNLNLSKYIIGYKKNDHIYDLYAVCNHSGRLQGGHYTSFVKTQNDKWYHFNDSIVTKINNIEKTIISSKAYCLFYKKKI